VEHLQKAAEFQKITEGNLRIDALVDFMIADIPRYADMILREYDQKTAR
jgi:hypothetical protein